jgi:hypothetical protein
MFKGIHVNRSALICTGMMLCVFLFVKCIDRESKHSKTDTTASVEMNARVSADQFAGSPVCASCHKDIYDSHILTPHYLTTRPASAEYIKGNFEPGKNRFAYDSDIVVAMEKRDSGFYQVGYYKGHEGIIKRFDIVVGSGSKGQTYITRFKNRMYQLPVSYFTAANKWANSPQYPTHPVLFNRPITSRCLECHTTFAHRISEPNHKPEDFDPNIIFGVDCEKCHGPGARHVEFQRQNPKSTLATYILNPAKFSRQQNLDLCGLCHGGKITNTRPSFEFVAGDKISDYFQKDTSSIDPGNIDMHGNQLGLLSSSRCFRMSQMNCTTCHNPHENERGNIVLFSQRCQTCHSEGHNNICKMTSAIGPSIKLNCINCHMPLKPSKIITELLPGDTKPTAALVRSHLIAIYHDETAKYKNSLHK